MKSPRKSGLSFRRSLYGWEEKGEVPVDMWLDTERVESQRKMLLKFLIFFPLLKPMSGNLWNVNMWLL